MRTTAQGWTSAGLAALLLLLIGGCGRSRPAVGAGQLGTPTASAPRVATMTVVPTPGAMTAVPTPGAVTLHLKQTHAGVTDAVSVTVANDLPTAILVEDHQSECTVVTLERQGGGGWLAVAPCQLETPTRLLPIPSGTAQSVTLKPEGSSQPGMWQAGTYRFTLHYTAGAETGAQGQTPQATPAPAGIVYSQMFTIG
jgi:hypothetical protein